MFLNLVLEMKNKERFQERNARVCHKALPVTQTFYSCKNCKRKKKQTRSPIQ